MTSIFNFATVWKNASEPRKQILESMLRILSTNSFERTAHLLAYWPTLLDSLFDYIDDPLCSNNDEKVLAIRAIGCVLRCKASSFDLRKVLGLLRKFKHTPLLRDSVLRALEESAKSRSSGRLSGCGAFWTFPGNDEIDQSRPVSAFLNVTLPPLPMSSNKDEQWWPFTREYGIFAMVRVGRFQPGEGERCTSLLRAISFNGAKLQIWLTEKNVHVSVYEPLQQASEPQPSVSAASVFSSISALASGPKPATALGGLFGSVAKSAMRNVSNAAQQAAVAAVSAASKGLRGGVEEESTNMQLEDGHSTTSASASTLLPERWVSIHVHHRALSWGSSIIAGGANAELSVFVDGRCVLSKARAPFPKGLGGAPLALFRIGEGLCGEIGPVYLFNGSPVERSPLEMNPLPLSPRAQGALSMAHTGDTLALGPLSQSLAQTSSFHEDLEPVPTPYSAFNPICCSATFDSIAGPLLLDGDSVSCVHPDVSGTSGAGAVLVGVNGVTAFSTTNVRDVIRELGGLLELLFPLLEAAEAAENSATFQVVSKEPPTPSSNTESRSVAAQCIDILTAFLRGHAGNLASAHQMHVIDFLRLGIAPCLQSRSWIRKITESKDLIGERPFAAEDARIAQSLFALVDACSTGEQDQLHIDGANMLLTWLPLFANSSVHVQHALLERLNMQVRARPEMIRSQIGMQRLTDAIYLWYIAVCRGIRFDSKEDAEDAAIVGSSVKSPYTWRISRKDRFTLLGECVMIIANTLGAPLMKVNRNENVGGGIGSSRGGSIDRIIELRKEDVEPLVALVLFEPLQPRSSSDSSDTANEKEEDEEEKEAKMEEATAERLRAEVLSLLIALLDSDCSRLGGSSQPGQTTQSRETAEVVAALIAEQTKGRVHISQNLLGLSHHQLGAQNAPSSGGSSVVSVGAETLASSIFISGSFNSYSAIEAAFLFLSSEKKSTSSAIPIINVLNKQSALTDFGSTLLFGVLLTARSDALIACTIRAVAHFYRSMTARQKSLDDRFREAAGHVGRTILRAANDPSRIGASLVSGMATVVAAIKGAANQVVALGEEVMGDSISSGLGNSDTSSAIYSGSGYFGSIWSRSFDQIHGFDVIFFILKLRSRSGHSFSDLIYSALLEIVFLPDAIGFLTDVDIEGPVIMPDSSISKGSTSAADQPPSLMIFSGEGGRGERGSMTMSAEARTVCLRCAAEHALTRTFGKEPWIRSYCIDLASADITQSFENSNISSSSSNSSAVSSPISSTLSLIDRCSISSPAAILLLLRLLPVMDQQHAKRTLSDLRSSISPRSGALYGSAKTWGDKLRELCANAVVAGARAWEVRITRFLTREIASDTIDVNATLDNSLSVEIEKEGHYFLHNLLWGSLLVPSNQAEGWRSFQRLLCLEPSSGSIEKTRLLVSTLFEGSFEAAASAERRARSLPVSAIDNVIRLTALVEREAHSASQQQQELGAPQSSSSMTSACSLVRACLLYWDSHLAYHAASEDLSIALLMRAPLLGETPVGLRSLLLSLSLWQLRACLPSHHDVLPCLIRLQRLVPSSFKLPNMTEFIQEGQSSTSSSSSSEITESSMNDESESTELPETGYMGLRPETWQLVALHSLRLFLLDVRARVVASQTSVVEPLSTLPESSTADFLDALSASSNIAISTLESLFNDHPSLLPSSSKSNISMKTILSRHRSRMKRDGRARAAASSLSPINSDGNDDEGSGEGEWGWILPFSSPFSSTAESSPQVSWLDDPSWVNLVQPSLLAYATAERASHDAIDRMKAAVGRGIILTVVRPDEMQLAPLDELKDLLQTDRDVASSPTGGSLSHDDFSTGNKDSDRTQSFEDLSVANLNPQTVRSNVLIAMGAGMALARSGAERVGSVVTAGIQRGISGFAALAASVEAESEAEMEVHALHGRSLSNTEAGSQNQSGGQSGTIFTLFSQLSSNASTATLPSASNTTFTSPRWWDAQWKLPAAAVRKSCLSLYGFERDRRVFGLSHRADVLSAVRAARQAFIAKNNYIRQFDLFCLSTSTASDVSIDFKQLQQVLLPLKLSTIETSRRSRLRLEIDSNPTDYSTASYDFRRNDAVAVDQASLPLELDPTTLIVPSSASLKSAASTLIQNIDENDDENADEYDDDNDVGNVQTSSQTYDVTSDLGKDHLPTSASAARDSEISKRPRFAISPGEYLQTFGHNGSTQCDCKRITPEGVVRGILRISNVRMFFDPIVTSQAEATTSAANNGNGTTSSDSSNKGINVATASRVAIKPLRDQPSHQRWSLSLLTSIRQRRFMLKPSAAEFFFQDGASLFLDFPGHRVRDVLRLLRSRRLRPSVPFLARNESDVVAAAERASIRWANRELSNYEYIMELNSLAGRTYNDLTQYFVMPWVISDYTSPTINLEDPSIYRDLALPVGALNPTRLASFKERMEGMPVGEGLPPPFLYGSHYSSAGALLYYLIRLEPFTSLAVELQSGHFDVADRLFFSVRETWRGVTHSMSDVKELIPEWYTTPEMFVNSRRLPLGRLQRDNIQVDHVELPPWANGSPHTFVQINRAALESEYVSSKLHLWVDLIFGHKQRSVEANNVFFHLTYEGEVDVDAIQDKMLRDAVEAQIVHFGQTPSRLFSSSHRPRLPREACAKSLLAPHLPHRFPITNGSPLPHHPLQSHDRKNAPNIDCYTVADHPYDGDVKNLSTGLRMLPPQDAFSHASKSIVLLAALGPRFTIGGTVRGGNAGRVITAFGGKYACVHHWLPSFSPDSRMPFEFKKRPPVNMPGSTLSVWEGGRIRVTKNGASVRVKSSTSSLIRNSRSVGSVPSVCELMLQGSSSFGPATAASSSIAAMLYKSASVAAGGDVSTMVHSTSVGGDRLPRVGDFTLSSPRANNSASIGDAASPAPLSSSMSSFIEENVNDSALIFSCGYADGSLRWQRFAAGGNAGTSPLLGAASGGISSKADIWCVRNVSSLPCSSRASDVSCVAIDEGIFGGEVGLHYIITGHTDGCANIFRISFTSSGLMSDAAESSIDTKERIAFELENKKIGQECVCSDISGNAHSQLADSGRQAIFVVHGPSTNSLLLRTVELIPIDTTGGLPAAATSVALSMSARLSAVGTASGRVTLYDARSGQALHVLFPPSGLLPSMATSLRPEWMPVHHIALLMSTVIVHWVSSSRNKEENVTSVSSQHIPSKQSILTTFSFNGARLATKRYQPEDAWITSLTATHDSEAIVFGSSDGTLSMWHSHTLSPSSTFPSLKPQLAGSDSQRNSSSSERKNDDNRLGLYSNMTILPPDAGSLLPSTSITSLLLTDNEQVILAGTGDGKLAVLIDSSRQSEALVKRQLDALLI